MRVFHSKSHPFSKRWRISAAVGCCLLLQFYFISGCHINFNETFAGAVGGYFSGKPKSMPYEHSQRRANRNTAVQRGHLPVNLASVGNDFIISYVYASQISDSPSLGREELPAGIRVSDDDLPFPQSSWLAQNGTHHSVLKIGRAHSRKNAYHAHILHHVGWSAFLRIQGERQFICKKCWGQQVCVLYSRSHLVKLGRVCIAWSANNNYSHVSVLLRQVNRLADWMKVGSAYGSPTITNVHMKTSCQHGFIFYLVSRLTVSLLS